MVATRRRISEARSRGGDLGPAAAASLMELVPAILTFAVITALGVAGGGFQPSSWRLEMVALLALVVAALLLRDEIVVSRNEWLLVLLLTGLAAWAAISTVWSIHPSNSGLEAERTLLYAVGACALFLGATRGSLVQIVAGAVAGVTAVAAVGLGEHYLTTYPRSPVEGTLLFQPLGYANALGTYAAIGVLLSTGLALSTQRRAARVASLASLLVLVPTLALTSSRGGWLALAGGAVVMLFLLGKIRSRRVFVGVLLVSAAAALAIGSSRRDALPVDGKRLHYWHVAWQEYESAPAAGTGAGTFGDYFWRYHRPSQGFTLVAHNVYLETLGELGPVGLVLLVLALGVPLVALPGRKSPVAAAAGGAYIAFVLHAAIDWDWQVPALTLVGLFSGGVVLVNARREARMVSPELRYGLMAAAIACTMIVAYRLQTGPNFHV